MPFARFVALALYDPAVGYYRRQGARIGYAAGTDFFTASTSGAVFGELVAQACRGLLGERDPADFEFVEIGAEPAGPEAGRGILAGVPHPFKSARALGIGETVPLSGRCIVFSNELLDAQPFDRYRFRDGAWRPLGVALDGARLVETERASAGPVPGLPRGVEGQIFDAPTGATQLVRMIAAQPWTGLFAALDYGLSLAALSQERPGGTARAYHRHRQSNDLLSRPGEQDLTCHVCWDWIAAALAEKGFKQPALESQEEFFVRHAADRLEKMIKAGSDAQKRSLTQLIHPAYLGQKFQVIHASRW